MLFVLIIFGVIGLDQLSKLFIQKSFELGQSFPIIENVFHLTYIHNYGAAFSFFQNQTVFLIVIQLLLITFIVGFMVVTRKRSHKILLVSMSLIVAGGVGNLIDRIAYGYVVDYFDFRVFPIFNIADISVCTGCGLLLLFLFIIEPRLAKKELLTNEQ